MPFSSAESVISILYDAIPELTSELEHAKARKLTFGSWVLLASPSLRPLGDVAGRNREYDEEPLPFSSAN
jgi:hypothetical protein